MRTLMIAAACVVGLSTPLAAQTFTSKGGIDVTPTDGGFAVLSDGGLGARGYWCGAADYARRVLNAPGNAALYVAQPRQRGASGRSPVVFTLDPAGLTPRPTVILGSSVTRPGSQLSVGHAIGFCADFVLFRGPSR